MLLLIELRRAVRCGAFASIIAAPALGGAAAPTPAPSIASSDVTATLEKFEVTGSRLKRLDYEGPSPVTLVTAEEIADSGFATVGEFLRQSPWMSSASAPSNVLGFNSGQTEVNLRGLGANNTLVLINGRRPAPYGQTGFDSQSFDLGGLPPSAIDSIEILRDGASALYGSDAVAGVVNIKLKKNYRGTLVTTGFRQFEVTDYARREFALTHGQAAGNFSLLLTADYAANHAVRFADRPVSRTDDLRRFGGGDFRQSYGYPAQLLLPTGTPGVPASFANDYITLGTVDPRGGVTQSPPTAKPLATGFVVLPSPGGPDGLPVTGDSRNIFDRAPWSTMIPAGDDYGAQLTLDYAWRDSLAFFAELGWRRQRQTSTFHPTPATGAPLPAANPYNPFGVTVPTLRVNLTEVGARSYENTNVIPRFVAGARGKIFSGWDYEVAGEWSQNRVALLGNNFVTAAAYADALAGKLGGWFNPFGPSDPGVADRLRSITRSAQTARTALADAKFSGELFRLPAGPLAVALGGETRAERYFSEPDPIAVDGGYLGLSARGPLAVRRRTAAAFAEFGVPVLRSLELQLAGRAEHYNDFGSAVKPKLGAAWRPGGGLLLRFNYGESFKAPELLQLYLDQSEAFTTVSDVRRPDLGPYTIRYLTGGNPALKAENSATLSYGLVYAPPSLPGLSFSANYYVLHRRDGITTIGTGYILEHERDPLASTAAFITRAPALPNGTPGEILSLRDTYNNYDTGRGAGWDFDTSYEHTFSTFGRVRLSAAATLSPPSNPEPAAFQRASGSLQWRGLTWSAGTFVTWIAHHDGAGVNYSGGSTTQHARAFTTLTLARKFSRRLKVTLGLANAFAVNPPVDYSQMRGYDIGTYDNTPRTWSLTLARDF